MRKLKHNLCPFVCVLVNKYTLGDVGSSLHGHLSMDISRRTLHSGQFATWTLCYTDNSLHNSP